MATDEKFVTYIIQLTSLQNMTHFFPKLHFLIVRGKKNLVGKHS